MPPTWPTLPAGFVATSRHTARHGSLMRQPVVAEGVAALSAGREPPEPDFLAELMARPRYAGRLEPEESLSVACADELRRLTGERRLRCVWLRVPNEIPMGSRLGQMHQAKAAAMGVVAGAPDLLFLWDRGAGGIELKVERAQGVLVTYGTNTGAPRLAARAPGRTYQRGGQRDFQRWCEETGVRYALARSVGEMLEILRGWGRL